VPDELQTAREVVVKPADERTTEAQRASKVSITRSREGAKEGNEEREYDNLAMLAFRIPGFALLSFAPSRELKFAGLFPCRSGFVIRGITALPFPKPIGQ
jgi:hypothetical protein